MSDVAFSDLANALRALSMDAVEKAKSGHPGMPMGMADVATVLWTRFLKHDPAHPTWPDRDRFVLSAGHGSMLLYSLLHLTGYEKVTLDQLKAFRQLGSLTAGHPEVEVDAGIETTTGPLGQGISNAVGMALAERLMASRFGDELVDHHTYVIASDGDLMEGISHESCALAGHLGLGKLIVLYDDNGISIDGSTDLAFTEDTTGRFEAYGWQVLLCNGHDSEAITACITEAQGETARPTLIRCKTTIGYGAPTKAGSAKSHGAPLGAEEIAGARKALDWPHAPFEIPEAIARAWQHAGRRAADVYAHWNDRYASAETVVRDAFDAALDGAIPEPTLDALEALKADWADAAPKLATRQASGKVLDAIKPRTPTLIGGSADLTGSNNTKTGVSSFVTRDGFAGRYINYGVREHGMAAIMNGMALHRGIIPYAGTFLTFSDYCRPALRLAALMGIRVIHVMTHDSIGLGEDGPTHQPVEHLAALRAMPNLNVFRPADAIETAEAWELALDSDTGPSVLALTRQGLTAQRRTSGENLSAKGAYILAEAEAAHAVTLLATGSEVDIAVAAKAILEADGVGARVVSMPCWRLFDRQDADYRAAVLGGRPRVGIEAAVRHGWDRYLGDRGAFIGMEGFGASGPYAALYEHFGITPDAVVAAARGLL